MLWRAVKAAARAPLGKTRNNSVVTAPIHLKYSTKKPKSCGSVSVASTLDRCNDSGTILFSSAQDKANVVALSVMTCKLKFI